ncbi:MAG: Arc family DNA-binding protein [Inquilinus sp.]|uniref:Arc family DNA-binding protein n=1 Tax=Inquilinus sp. TaxID=1932117 RepID=UPI003F3CE06E
MADKFPSQSLDKFVLRMPDGMRDRIADAAKKNNRTMNAEIIHRLESTFARKGNPPLMRVTLTDPASPMTFVQFETAVRAAAEQAIQLAKQLSPAETETDTPDRSKK